MRVAAICLAGAFAAVFPVFSGEPAAEPAVRAAWQRYWSNPEQGRAEWDAFCRRTAREFEQQVISPDPETKKLSEELLRRMTAMQQDPELKALKERIDAAAAAYRALDADSGRGREIAYRRRVWKSLRQQYESAAAKYRNAVRAQKEELARRRSELLESSDAPAARKMRALSALARMDKAGPWRADFAPGPVTANPFAGLYSGLTFRDSGTNWTARTAAVLLEALKPENPDCPPELLEAFAQLRGGMLQALPIPSPEEAAKPGRTPLEEVCHALRSIDGKDENLNPARKRISLAMLKIPRDTFTRFEVQKLLADLASDRQVREVRNRSAAELLTGLLRQGKIRGDAVQYAYNFLSGSSDEDEMWKRLDRLRGEVPDFDPWLGHMVAARAAVARAWEKRGGGYADTVGQEGWQGFRDEIASARGHLEAALKLEPERANPLFQLIVVEMASGTVAARIDAFKRIIVNDPDNRNAYGKIKWALLPRWGGSHRLLLQLGDAALAYPETESVIPAFGFDMMGYVAWDYPDSRWKNVYLRPGIIESGDRLFEARRKAEARPGSVRFLLYHRLLFEMATLRYDRASKTAEELGGKEVLERCDRDDYWRGNGMTNWFPRIPAFRSGTALELALFTGEHGDELRALEKRYLKGGEAAGELAELIGRGAFTPEEKNHLLELFASWSMSVEPQEYFDCNTGALFPPFQVAGSRGYPQIAARMIALGYDYRRSERYPGETAVRIAKNGVNPELLDALKKAGDPLNRPEPEHGRSPIHAAAFAPNSLMVAKLLELGVSPTAPDRENHTPVQLAAARHGVEALQSLLAAGAGVDEQDNDGDTALMFVMEQNSPHPIPELLIRHSKNLNIVNHRGESALHYAARLSRDPGIIRAMLKAGADPHLRNGAGETPADLARKAGKTEFVRLLDGGR
ncbi:MAG: ankyrin repeat domain-containing protein [Lentisphaeria bacterium]|nr:ankyrin repeat domain-containing protein [Lentisphaeria bacterium]